MHRPALLLLTLTAVAISTRADDFRPLSEMLATHTQHYPHQALSFDDPIAQRGRQLEVAGARVLILSRCATLSPLTLDAALFLPTDQGWKIASYLPYREGGYVPVVRDFGLEMKTAAGTVFCTLLVSGTLAAWTPAKPTPLRPPSLKESGDHGQRTRD